jgi:hypothetical protein
LALKSSIIEKLPKLKPKLPKCRITDANFGLLQARSSGESHTTTVATTTIVVITIIDLVFISPKFYNQFLRH